MPEGLARGQRWICTLTGAFLTTFFGAFFATFFTTFLATFFGAFLATFLAAFFGADLDLPENITGETADTRLAEMAETGAWKAVVLHGRRCEVISVYSTPRSNKIARAAHTLSWQQLSSRNEP